VSAIYQPVVGQIVDLVRTQVLTVEEETSKAPKVLYLQSTPQIFNSLHVGYRQFSLLADLAKTISSAIN
jgi:hypothetical protein